MLQQPTYSQPTPLLSKMGSGYSSRSHNYAEIQRDLHINRPTKVEYEIVVTSPILVNLKLHGQGIIKH